MKKTLLFLAFIILAALPLKAQVIGQPVTIVNTAPGTCTTNIDLAQEYQGVIYLCVGGNYAAVSTTAAGGTVTGLHATRVVVGASATTLTDDASFNYDTTNHRLVVGGASTGVTAAINAVGDGRVLALQRSTAGTANLYFDFLTSAGTEKGYVGYGGGSGGADTFSIANLTNAAVNVYTNSLIRFIVDNAGLTTVGATGLTGQFNVSVAGASTVGQIIKLAASQSADALEVQNSSSTVLAKIDSVGAFTAANLTSSALTSGRVPYVTTGGLLTDSANLTWDTSTLLLAKSGSYPLLRIRNTAGGAGYWDIGPQYVNNFGISGNGGSPAFTIDTGNFVGIGTNIPLATLHVGPGTNLFVTTNILSNAVLANTIVQSGHAFGDVAAIDRDGGIGYASYDTNVTYSGTFNYDHWVGYQTNLQYGSSGTLTNGYGYYFGPHINAGTVTNLYGAYYVNPTGAGAVTNNYAIYIENQTKGGTLNYALYAAGGIVAINGALKFITDNTYDIGAVSSNRPASIYAGSGLYSGGNIEASSGGALTIKSRFRIYSNADGTAVLYNNATTDFTRLQFGGTTSSYPSLKRSTTSIAVRLADDSADASLTASGLTLSGNFFAGPSTIETFTSTGSAIGATLNYYTDSQTIYYSTAAAANDVTLNVDASASVDLNTRLATGQVVTVVLAMTNTGTAYKCNTLQIHTVGQTIKWVGGSAPTGNINATDFYTFTIMKTGASTYYVTGSQTSYK